MNVESFVAELVERFPELRGTYDAHIENMGGELLAHALFWDVTNEVVASYLGEAEPPAVDWRTLILFLEESYADGDIDVRKVIVTSFLLYLPFPQQPGHAIATFLGPRLAERFRVARPDG